MSPFGVELPANLGTPDSGSAPSADAAPSGADTISSKAPSTEIPGGAPKENLTDLDKLERFRFEGREWKRDELRNAYLRQQDYSRKTHELAETRKYADNFAVDLRAVIQDRNRLEEFRRVYPQEFVARAEEILEQLGQKQPGGTQSHPTANDPVRSELELIKKDLGQWKQEKQQAEVAQIQSWLDNKFDSLSKKYTHVGKMPAAIKAINADAEVMARQGTKITEEVLDKLFKQYDGEIKASWVAMRKSEITQQQRAGTEARDIGPGGGAPGAAPKGPKNFKEAREMMIADLQANGRR